MAEIKLITKRFRGAYKSLNKTEMLTITRRAFLRASLTLGFQRFGDFWHSGWRSWTHRLGTGLSGLAYLESSSANLHLSPDYGRLDGSEKSAMSYWQGMIFAKLVAEQKLSVRWLAHVDDMRSKGLLTTTASTNERGDFVGHTLAGDWHVVEAKGRSTHLEKGLVKKAKRQAALVKTINGVAPHTHSACVSCLWKNPIVVLFDDPPGARGGKGEQWQVEAATLWTYYYTNLAGYIGAVGSRRRDSTLPDYLFAPLEPYFIDGVPPFIPDYWLERRGVGLYIGLPRQIVESPTSAPDVLRRIQSDPAGYAGLDGVALVGTLPDWEG